MLQLLTNYNRGFYHKSVQKSLILCCHQLEPDPTIPLYQFESENESCIASSLKY